MWIFSKTLYTPTPRVMDDLGKLFILISLGIVHYITGYGLYVRMNDLIGIEFNKIRNSKLLVSISYHYKFTWKLNGNQKETINIRKAHHGINAPHWISVLYIPIHFYIVRVRMIINTKCKQYYHVIELNSKQINWIALRWFVRFCWGDLRQS